MSLSGTGTGFCISPRVAALTFTRTQQFTASSGGATSSVDGVIGGLATFGTITAAGYLRSRRFDLTRGDNQTRAAKQGQRFEPLRSVPSHLLQDLTSSGLGRQTPTSGSSPESNSRRPIRVNRLVKRVVAQRQQRARPSVLRTPLRMACSPRALCSSMMRMLRTSPQYSLVCERIYNLLAYWKKLS